MQLSDGPTEWALLQNQFDSYEKWSLLIKLASVLVVAVALILDRADVWIAMLLLILWLQDAIWKTFQSRIELRLLALEAMICAGDVKPDKGFQFNTDFLRNRPSGVGIIGEYLGQAARPTVAFPYLALLAVIACRLLLV
jgi:hypothetical protein